MFKIALNAGHYLYEPGRRCMAAFDKNQTREWVLNSRICEKVEKNLKAYTGYELLRLDDRSGETLVILGERTKKANSFGADVYVSVHHNGGIGGGKGGGIVAYTYLKVDKYTSDMQKLLYNKLIEKTGLKGNRATPLAKADYAEVRDTKMPAVLLECGFMDSATDTPVIITEDFADKAAEAITEALVTLGKLEKSENTQKPEESGKLYRVQVGAFSVKENAEKMASELKSKGYSVIIKEN